MSGPLADIAVVDVTTARSGPTCTRHLADLGAEVVRVTRGTSSFGGSDDMNLNRNKRSIALDLKDPKGVEALHALIDRADVFVENWRPGVKHRLGFSPDAMLERNPRLVYGSISGFGQDGPYADRPGVDQIAQGMSGLMAVTGPPDGGPWRVGVAVSDVYAGTLLAQGILAALFARERTGRGQWVHTSLLEGAIHLLDFQAVRWTIDGVEPPKEGNNHPVLPAMGTFATADGVVNIGVLTGFERFAEMIGRPDLVTDPRFATRDDRIANKVELNEIVAGVLATQPTQHWIDLLAESFPTGPVYRIPELFSDPQVRHLQVTTTVESHAGPVDVLTYPVHFSDTPASIRQGAHTPGQDTAEVLGELGL